MNHEGIESLRIVLAVENETLTHDLSLVLYQSPNFSLCVIREPEPDLQENMVNADVVIGCEIFLKNVDSYPYHVMERIRRKTKILGVISKKKRKICSHFLYLLDGCIFFGEELFALPSMIGLCNKGYKVFPSGLQCFVTDFAKEATIVSELSLYECALLQALERSPDDKALARHMGEPRAAIRQQLRNVYKKLDVSSRMAARQIVRRHMDHLQLRRRELMRQGATNRKADT